MSIKVKLPALVLAAIFVNILLLYGYYTFFLSGEISEYNSSMRAELQDLADRTSEALRDRPDYARELTNLSNAESIIIRVEDGSGGAVFHIGNETGVNIECTASSLFYQDGHTYLLRLIKPILLTDLSSFEIVWNLFKAEVLIVCIILLLIAVLIYFRYVKPIVSLRGSMESYQSGLKPRKTWRRDEIGHLQNRFVELTEAIEEEKSKQNRIIASISHDIKTPLTSVMGYAERLKKNALSKEKHTFYVDTIYQKSVSIKNLIEEFDDYLSYHKQSELKLQRLTVSKLCAVINADFGGELGERGVAFSVDADCPDGALLADISKMRRVFGNMIDNSLKHPGRETPAVAVRCKRESGTALFSVEDNGAGVPDTELKRIFDPFYTSDKGRSVAGLGLSICREIVEAHGGKIWSENKKNGGLRISFRLPLIRDN